MKEMHTTGVYLYAGRKEPDEWERSKTQEREGIVFSIFLEMVQIMGELHTQKTEEAHSENTDIFEKS